MTSAAALKVWDGKKWQSHGLVEPGARVIAVGASGTTTTLTTSATTVNGSGTITLTATVTGTPSGSVIFEYLSGATWVAISTDTGSPWTATRAVSTSTSFRARYLGNGIAQPSTSATKVVTVKQLTTIVKTYSSNGSASYSGGGSQRTDTTDLYQGYFSGTWDEQRSVACFPTTIQADLAGAYDITKLEVYLYCKHWGPGDGGTARIRTCNETSPPGTWGGVSNLSAYDGVAWSSKSGAKWCDVSSLKGVPADWQSGGTKKAIALYAASSGGEYYGYFDGVGDGEPQLRITYRKYV